MSGVSSNHAKGDKVSKKFSSSNINDVFQGESTQSQPRNPIPKYGFQSIGKVIQTRRVPPPANLPSLKSQNFGNDPNINLVPSGGQGWGVRSDVSASGAEAPRATGASVKSDGTIAAGDTTTVAANPLSTSATPGVGSVGAQPAVSAAAAGAGSAGTAAPDSRAPVSGEKSWSSVMTGQCSAAAVAATAAGGHTAAAAGQRQLLQLSSPQFQHEFPQLSQSGSATETTARNERRAPGDLPSLRPNTEGSWAQGGRRANNGEPGSSGTAAAGPGGPAAAAAPPAPAGPALLLRPTSTAHQQALAAAAAQFRGAVPQFLTRPAGSLSATANGAGTSGTVTTVSGRSGTVTAPRATATAVTSRSRPLFTNQSAPIVRAEDLRSLDQISSKHDQGWAGAATGVDYNKKLNFSDDEDDEETERPSRQQQQRYRRPVADDATQDESHDYYSRQQYQQQQQQQQQQQSRGNRFGASHANSRDDTGDDWHVQSYTGGGCAPARARVLSSSSSSGHPNDDDAWRRRQQQHQHDVVSAAVERARQKRHVLEESSSLPPPPAQQQQQQPLPLSAASSSSLDSRVPFSKQFQSSLPPRFQRQQSAGGGAAGQQWAAGQQRAGGQQRPYHQRQPPPDRSDHERDHYRYDNHLSNDDMAAVQIRNRINKQAEGKWPSDDAGVVDHAPTQETRAGGRRAVHDPSTSASAAAAAAHRYRYGASWADEEEHDTCGASADCGAERAVSPAPAPQTAAKSALACQRPVMPVDKSVVGGRSLDPRGVAREARETRDGRPDADTGSRARAPPAATAVSGRARGTDSVTSLLNRPDMEGMVPLTHLSSQMPAQSKKPAPADGDVSTGDAAHLQQHRSGATRVSEAPKNVWLARQENNTALASSAAAAAVSSSSSLSATSDSVSTAATTCGLGVPARGEQCSGDRRSGQRDRWTDQNWSDDRPSGRANGSRSKWDNEDHTISNRARGRYDEPHQVQVAPTPPPAAGSSDDGLLRRDVLRGASTGYHSHQLSHRSQQQQQQHQQSKEPALSPPLEPLAPNRPGVKPASTDRRRDAAAANRDRRDRREPLRRDRREAAHIGDIGERHVASGVGEAAHTAPAAAAGGGRRGGDRDRLRDRPERRHMDKHELRRTDQYHQHHQQQQQRSKQSSHMLSADLTAEDTSDRAHTLTGRDDTDRYERRDRGAARQRRDPARAGDSSDWNSEQQRHHQQQQQRGQRRDNHPRERHSAAAPTAAASAGATLASRSGQRRTGGERHADLEVTDGQQTKPTTVPLCDDREFEQEEEDEATGAQHGRQWSGHRSVPGYRGSSVYQRSQRARGMRSHRPPLSTATAAPAGSSTTAVTTAHAASVTITTTSGEARRDNRAARRGARVDQFTSRPQSGYSTATAGAGATATDALLDSAPRRMTGRRVGATTSSSSGGGGATTTSTGDSLLSARKIELQSIPPLMEPTRPQALSPSGHTTVEEDDYETASESSQRAVAAGSPDSGGSRTGKVAVGDSAECSAAAGTSAAKTVLDQYDLNSAGVVVVDEQPDAAGQLSTAHDDADFQEVVSRKAVRERQKAAQDEAARQKRREERGGGRRGGAVAGGGSGGGSRAARTGHERAAQSRSGTAKAPPPASAAAAAAAPSQQRPTNSSHQPPSAKGQERNGEPPASKTDFAPAAQQQPMKSTTAPTPPAVNAWDRPITAVLRSAAAVSAAAAAANPVTSSVATTSSVSAPPLAPQFSPADPAAPFFQRQPPAAAAAAIYDSGVPSQTLIFENTNLRLRRQDAGKMGPVTALAQLNSNSAAGAGAASQAGAVSPSSAPGAAPLEKQRPLASAGGTGEPLELPHMFAAEDVRHMKLDFTFDSPELGPSGPGGRGACVGAMTVSDESLAPTSSMCSATAGGAGVATISAGNAELNMKIASVKRVWDTPSVSPQPPPGDTSAVTAGPGCTASCEAAAAAAKEACSSSAATTWSAASQLQFEVVAVTKPDAVGVNVCKVKPQQQHRGVVSGEHQSCCPCVQYLPTDEASTVVCSAAAAAAAHPSVVPPAAVVMEPVSYHLAPSTISLSAVPSPPSLLPAAAIGYQPFQLEQPPSLTTRPHSHHPTITHHHPHHHQQQQHHQQPQPFSQYPYAVGGGAFGLMQTPPPPPPSALPPHSSVAVAASAAAVAGGLGGEMPPFRHFPPSVSSPNSATAAAAAMLNLKPCGPPPTAQPPPNSVAKPGSYQHSSLQFIQYDPALLGSQLLQQRQPPSVTPPSNVFNSSQSTAFFQNGSIQQTGNQLASAYGLQQGGYAAGIGLGMQQLRLAAGLPAMPWNSPEPVGQTVGGGVASLGGARGSHGLMPTGGRATGGATVKSQTSLPPPLHPLQPPLPSAAAYRGAPQPPMPLPTGRPPPAPGARYHAPIQRPPPPPSALAHHQPPAAASHLSSDQQAKSRQAVLESAQNFFRNADHSNSALQNTAKPPPSVARSALDKAVGGGSAAATCSSSADAGAIGGGDTLSAIDADSSAPAHPATSTHTSSTTSSASTDRPVSTVATGAPDTEQQPPLPPPPAAAAAATDSCVNPQLLGPTAVVD